MKVTSDNGRQLGLSSSSPAFRVSAFYSAISPSTIVVFSDGEDAKLYMLEDLREER